MGSIGSLPFVIFIELRAAEGVGETHDIQPKVSHEMVNVGLIDLALSPFSLFFEFAGGRSNGAF
jgi:hypothetical protein